MSEQEITTKYVPISRVIAVRGTVPVDGSLPARFSEVGEALQLRPGPWQQGIVIALYYNQPGEDWDIEIGVTVPEDHDEVIPMASGETMTIREFPSIDTAASIIHKGAYDTLCQSYNALIAWITSNSYQIAGPSREVYLNHPEDTAPENLLTEIQFPVMKV